METLKRKDLLTNEEFIPKKISQRFANSKNRIKYNNQKATFRRQKKAYIDNPIHKNHKILEQLLNNEKQKTFHKQFLLGKGIDFSVTTHIKLVDAIQRHCIYEFIYIFNEENITILNNSDGRY